MYALCEMNEDSESHHRMGEKSQEIRVLCSFKVFSEHCASCSDLVFTFTSSNSYNVCMKFAKKHASGKIYQPAIAYN